MLKNKLMHCGGEKDNVLFLNTTPTSDTPAPYPHSRRNSIKDKNVWRVTGGRGQVWKKTTEHHPCRGINRVGV